MKLKIVFLLGVSMMITSGVGTTSAKQSAKKQLIRRSEADTLTPVRQPEK